MSNPATRTGAPTSHFTTTLPVAENEALRRLEYQGESPERFHEIRQHKANKRSNLPATLTRQLTQQAAQDLAKTKPVTRQARQMAEDSKATLTSTDTQRNHTVAAATAQTTLTAMIVPLTGKDKTKAQQAEADIVKYADTITENSPRARKKVQAELVRVRNLGNKASSEQLARSAAKLSKIAADHKHNVNLGDGPRNMSNSNRADVTASPGGTRVPTKEYDKVKAAKAVAKPYIGSPLANRNYNIAVSPGGTIQSSKQIDPTSYSHPPPPTASSSSTSHADTPATPGVTLTSTSAPGTVAKPKGGPANKGSPSPATPLQLPAIDTRKTTATTSTTTAASTTSGSRTTGSTTSGAETRSRTRSTQATQTGSGGATTGTKKSG